MKTIHQIKEQMQYEEMCRVRRLIEDVENCIMKHFSIGSFRLSVHHKDKEFVVKELQNAGYTVTEEQYEIPPYSYTRTIVSWEVPNE